jgi:hypothetical protein
MIPSFTQICQCHYRTMTQPAVPSQFLTLHACNQYVQIDRTMRPSLFCDVTQSRIVISLRCFGTTYRSSLQGSSFDLDLTGRHPHSFFGTTHITVRRLAFLNDLGHGCSKALLANTGTMHPTEP